MKKGEKDLRFRTPARVLFRSDSKLEDLMGSEKTKEKDTTRKGKTPSLVSFLQSEITRDYVLDNDKERYSARREKMYSFMKIPNEVEKFMRYGFMHCTESFLFVYTFLPVRVILALGALITRPFSKCFGLFGGSKNNRLLTPAEVCDILKAVILIICTTSLLSVDTSMLYHVIKSQSVIKLYIFYNMLEIGDRLFSSFGQDTIDALFWTATEPRDRRREHLGVIPHLTFAIVYVILHSVLVLFQATTLNVAINANNKALLTIMMSNNFVELKGSVFKKFDYNNLFQVSCSDVRERFHLLVLLFIVILQTMREYTWKSDKLWPLLLDCIVVLVAELLVDWIKHAFITRFNELKLDVYRDYTTSLAYDAAQTRQKHAFTDHSDLVARRMGFIPLPLGVVVIRVLIHSVNIDSAAAVIICLIAYLCLWTIKILNSLLILGRACVLITQHEQDKLYNINHSPVNNNNNRTNSSPLMSHRPVKQHVDQMTSPTHPTQAFSPTVAQNVKTTPSPPGDLSSAAIFANSTVDLKNASLNEELLKIDGDDIKIEQVDENVRRSFPDINAAELGRVEDVLESGDGMKRAESEPNLNVSEKCDN